MENKHETLVNRSNQHSIRKIILVAIVFIVFVFVTFHFWWNGKPILRSDYLAELGQMRKPGDYIAEEDGTHLFFSACQIVTSEPSMLAPLSSPWDMNDVERVAAKNWIQENERAASIVDRALRMKFFWPQGYSLDGTVRAFHTTDLGYEGKAALLILWRGKMKAYDGDLDSGIKDILAAGNIGKCFGTKPSWAEWMNAIFWATVATDSIADIVRNGRLSTKELKDIETSVQNMASRWQNMDSQLAIQKFDFLDEVQRTFTDDGRGDGRVIPSKIGKNWSISNNGLLDYIRFTVGSVLHQPRRKATLECYDRAEAQFRRLWQSSGSKEKTIPSVSYDWRNIMSKTNCVNNEIVWWYFEWSYNYIRYVNINRDHVKKALATIAAAKYVAEKGSVPLDLDSIVAQGYLQEVPIDWFTGTPFIYDANDRAFIIHVSMEEKQKAARPQVLTEYIDSRVR